MVTITDVAKDKIQEVLKQNPGKYIRIVVQGSGWGGPRLGLALDEPEENEKTVPVNGIDVLISENIKRYVEKNTIDYIDSPYGGGFSIGRAGSSCC